jgi:transcription elongation factor Elf1
MDISTDDSSVRVAAVEKTKIECPQCRHVTSVDGITALKTRLNGHINCTTCDMDKDVCDFQ